MKHQRRTSSSAIALSDKDRMMQTLTTSPRFMNSFLQWGGCVTGLTGAVLVALQMSYSRWGFVFFLLSNICFFSYGRMIGAKGLYISQIGLALTSVLGIANYFFDGLGNKSVASLLVAVNTWGIR
jgi:hypothetical protein